MTIRFPANIFPGGLPGALLVLLTLPCFAGAAKADGLVLNYHLAIRSAPEAAATTAGKPFSSDADYAVTLFPRGLEIHDGTATRVYDFADRRATIADLNKKTVSSFPLYAIPVSNRQRKAAKLRQKQAGDATVSEVDVDMLFGADSGTSTAGQIQTALADGKTVFTAAGRPLAAFSLSETAVPVELQASYAHFLVYEATLHPLIRRQIAAAGKVFGTLSYTTHDSGSKTEVTLTLKGTDKTAAAGPAVPAGLTPSFGGDAQLDEAIRKSETPGPSQSALETKISDFLSKKDNLRAVLAAAELSLSFGPDALKASGPGQQALQAGHADPVAGATLSAINDPPQSSDGFKQSMLQLNKAEAAAPEDASLIELYRAEKIRAILDDPRRKTSPEEAQVLQQTVQKISAAVEADPWLAGAWCDLANADYRAGQVQQAWILWEQAARLAPGYPALKQVQDIQQQAPKDFPEYF